MRAYASKTARNRRYGLCQPLRAALRGAVGLSSTSMGDAAETDAHEDAPEWLDTAFDCLNATHFGGTLPRPIIVIYQTPEKTTAATVPAAESHVVFIAPQIIKQNERWAKDTLLHEMIHLALIAENGDGDAEHGERFTTLANSIGTKFDLRGVDPRSQAARSWPQSVRPSNYPQWIGGDCPIPRADASVEGDELVVFDEEP